MPRKKTLIIAEAGVNHNGHLDKALKLVEVAANAGADYVKFQTFKADNLATKTAPKADYQKKTSGASESQYDMLKRLELTYDMHLEIIKECERQKIKFLSSPFDVESLNLLVNEFKVDVIKLGSGELTNGPLLLAAARTKLPIILSTGMATIEEVEEAVGLIGFGYAATKSEYPSSNKFKKYVHHKLVKEKLSLLHCTTEYPCPLEDINLRALHHIKDRFDVNVGYSDHSEGTLVPKLAVAAGATIIEKHFTLDQNLEGPDHKASLEPEELTEMITSIRETEKILGNYEKKPSKSEKKNIKIARKSIIAAEDISTGTEFTEANLTIKRPATGISPMQYWDILGTTAKKKYKRNTSL